MVQEVLWLPLKEARENLRESTAPTLSLDCREDLWTAFLGTQREVCAPRATSRLFWSLPGLCQILAFPRTSPRGLGGSPGPHFLPGDINQLSNSPEAYTGVFRLRF